MDWISPSLERARLMGLRSSGVILLVILKAQRGRGRKMQNYRYELKFLYGLYYYFFFNKGDF